MCLRDLGLGHICDNIGATAERRVANLKYLNIILILFNYKNISLFNKIIQC